MLDARAGCSFPCAVVPSFLLRLTSHRLTAADNERLGKRPSRCSHNQGTYSYLTLACTVEASSSVSHIRSWGVSIAFTAIYRLQWPCLTTFGPTLSHSPILHVQKAHVLAMRVCRALTPRIRMRSHSEGRKTSAITLNTACSRQTTHARQTQTWQRRDSILNMLP